MHRDVWCGSYTQVISLTFQGSAKHPNSKWVPNPEARRLSVLCCNRWFFIQIEARAFNLMSPMLGCRCWSHTPSTQCATWRCCWRAPSWSTPWTSTSWSPATSATSSGTQTGGAPHCAGPGPQLTGSSAHNVHAVRDRSNASPDAMNVTNKGRCPGTQRLCRAILGLSLATMSTCCRWSVSISVADAAWY